MTLNAIIGFLSPIALLLIGFMLRFSDNESWRTYNRYWIWFIIGGALLLILKVCKYLM